MSINTEIIVTTRGTNLNEIRKGLMEQLELFSLKLDSPLAEPIEAREEKSEIDVTEIKKRGRPKKEETEQTEFDLGDDETSAKAAKALSLEDDIIPAFKNYAKENSREKAGKVLARFKVKSVRDLPADKFAEVLKALEA